MFASLESLFLTKWVRGEGACLNCWHLWKEEEAYVENCFSCDYCSSKGFLEFLPNRPGFLNAEGTECACEQMSSMAEDSALVDVKPEV